MKRDKKLLVVVDMQNDFINGSLGTPEAQQILPNVCDKINSFEGDVVFTMDTHGKNYRQTQEGQKLPVEHCIKDTDGWHLNEQIQELAIQRMIFEKPTFGSVNLATFIADNDYTDITFIGLCTDICVISNALLLKAFLPEAEINVDSSCCAGTTVENHDNALNAMKICQINVL